MTKRRVGGGAFEDWISRAEMTEELIRNAESVRARNEDGEELFQIGIDQRPLEARFDRLQMLEYALQHYVCENPQHLGFKEARGPFHRGPDVHLKKGRRWIHAEVEVRPENFVKHGHHRDPAFAEVRILIVPEQPIPPKLIKRLPPTIVRIERDLFVPWWREYRTRGGKADRSRAGRAAALQAVRADLAESIEDCVVTDVPCVDCEQTVVFRVEQPEPGWAWPDDRVDLRCPTCSTVLRNMKGVGDPRVVEVVPELRESTTRSGLMAHAEELLGRDDEG